MAARKTRPTGRRLNGTHYLAERDACIRGHKLEGENVVHRRDANHPNGGRMCRTCSRERARLDSRMRYWRKKWYEHQRVAHSHARACTDCADWLQQCRLWTGRLETWRLDGRRR